MQTACLRVIPHIGRCSRHMRCTPFSVANCCTIYCGRIVRSMVLQRNQHHQQTHLYKLSSCAVSGIQQALLHASASSDTNNSQNQHRNTEERNDTNNDTKPFDVDEELLRYDYEEFDWTEEEDDVEEPDEELYPIELKRGSTGVYDIEDLVELLHSENARDMCVISVPPEIKFVDYMVIVTGKSTRHLQAMALYVKKLYKLKRSKKDPPTCNVEGDLTSKWLAMDLGNIILHLFTSDMREIYDLESLWTVGPKYDHLCREDKESPDLSWVDDFVAGVKQFEAVHKPRTATQTMESLSGWHKT